MMRRSPRIFGRFLFFSLVSLSAMPLLIVSSMQAVIYVRARHASASQRLVQTAAALALRCSDYVDEHRRVIADLAGDFQRQGASQEHLSERHARYRGFLTMLATRPDGTIVAASPLIGSDGTPMAGRSVADRPYFQIPRRTLGPFVSPAFRGRGFGDDVIIAVSAPILTREKRFDGIVEGSLDLTQFERFASQFTATEGLKVLLLDDRGRVIFANGLSGYPLLSAATELENRARAGRATIFRIGNEWHVVARAPSAGGWTVLTARPLRLIHAATLWAFLITIAAVLIALGLSFTLARAIVEHASRSLVQSERRFREIVEHSFGLICIHDLDGRLLTLNPAAAAVLEYRVEDLVGQGLDTIMPPAAAPSLGAYLRRIAQTGHAEGLMHVRTRSGEERVWVYRNRLVVDDGETYVLGHALDVTERRRAERVLMQQALRDPLTGLANRALFRDRLSSAIEEHDGGVALVYVDLDGFKKINDEAGHAAGDGVLRETAERLRHATRATDTIARLGGDEFAVVLPDVGSQQQAFAIAEKIIHGIAAPYDIDGKRWNVTASAGVSIYPDHAQTAEALLESADAAMYRAKRAGKNQAQLAMAQNAHTSSLG